MASEPMPSDATPIDLLRSGQAAGERESLAGLLRRLVDEVVHLVRTELLLARTEVGESIASAAGGLALVAIGGLLGSVAIFCLLGGIVAWIAQSTGIVAAAFIVAAVAAVIAGVLLAVGVGKVRQVRLAPSRAVANLKRDAETLKGD